VAGEGESMSGIEFTDRYKALGIPYPDPVTMCKGQCEGIGWVPIHRDDTSEPWHTLWLETEKRRSSDDGYHFIKCPDCDGRGSMMKQ